MNLLVDHEFEYIEQKAVRTKGFYLTDRENMLYYVDGTRVTGIHDVINEDDFALPPENDRFNQNETVYKWVR